MSPEYVKELAPGHFTKYDLWLLYTRMKDYSDEWVQGVPHIRQIFDTHVKQIDFDYRELRKWERLASHREADRKRGFVFNE